MPNVNELLDIAKREISGFNSGEIFLLKDYEWNIMLRNIRLLLGILFFNYVNTTNNKVTAIEKTFSVRKGIRNMLMFRKFFKEVVH